MITTTKIVRMTFGVDEDTGNAWSKEELVKPLSYEQIEKLAKQFTDIDYKYNGEDEVPYDTFNWNGFALAIEKEHGIGDKK